MGTLLRVLREPMHRKFVDLFAVLLLCLHMMAEHACAVSAPAFNVPLRPTRLHQFRGGHCNEGAKLGHEESRRAFTSSGSAQTAAACSHHRAGGLQAHPSAPAGSVFMARRAPGKSYAGLWEFPGGKVEPGESDQEALVREFQEELLVKVTVGDFIACGEDGTVRLYCYYIHMHGEPDLQEHSELKWIPFADLEAMSVPPADVATIRFMVKSLHSPQGLHFLP